MPAWDFLLKYFFSLGKKVCILLPQPPCWEGIVLLEYGTAQPSWRSTRKYFSWYCCSLWDICHAVHTLCFVGNCDQKSCAEKSWFQEVKVFARTSECVCVFLYVCACVVCVCACVCACMRRRIVYSCMFIHRILPQSLRSQHIQLTTLIDQHRKSQQSPLIICRYAVCIYNLWVGHVVAIILGFFLWSLYNDYFKKFIFSSSCNYKFILL